MSPTLFIIFMDEIIKKCSKKSKKFKVGHWNLESVKISEGAFADDVVLIAEDERELQENLEIWNTVLEENGMKINKKKTKVMVIGEDSVEMKVRIDGIRLEQVRVFPYLGVALDEKGTQEVEIRDRVDKTLRLYYTMNNNFIGKQEITKQTKMKIFKTIYRPILTFGCESWVLSKGQKSKIQAVEMKYLRRVMGVTKRDRLRNIDIRRDLEIQPTLDFIEQRQLSWWGHLVRMEERRPVRRIWEARIERYKKRGRPRQTWDKTVAGILERKGTTWSDAKRLANNKDVWKKFVKN